MAESRKTVFVSYAHEDRRWADSLVRFLAPWIRDKRVNLWDDSRIDLGADWKVAIRQAMDEATVAVLLVTQNFLSSDFIARQELPFLLEKAKQSRLRLAWIAVGHSTVDATQLANFQAINDPNHPLDSLSGAKRDEAMVGIAKRIADAVTIRAFAGGLRVIDESVEPVGADIERRDADPTYVPSVRAEYEAAQDRVSFTGAQVTITAADLERLPDDDREFVADLEDSLEQNYARWKKLKKQLGDAGGALDDEVRGQLTRITRLICDDLNSILEFLRQMHKAELEDHYGRYRYLCGKVGAG